MAGRYRYGRIHRGLMPIFGGGASQMFDAETLGITHERFRPRITQVAKRLWGVYVFLTLFFSRPFMGWSDEFV